MSTFAAALENVIERITPLVSKVSRREWISRAVIFTLCALTSRICLLDAISPFGPALFAAAWSLNYSPLFALLGVVVGALTAPAQVLPGIAGTMLFFIAATVYKTLRKRVIRHEMLLIFLLSLCAAIPLFRLGALYDAFMGTLEALMAFTLYFIFYRALSLGKPKMRGQVAEEEFLGLCVLAGTLVLGLANMTVYDFSLASIVAVTMTLLAGFFGGAASGTAAAVSMGLTLAAGGAQLAFVGALAACGLAAGALRRLTRLGVALGFVLAEAIVVFYTASNALPMRDAFIGAALFLVLPGKLISPVGRMLDARRRREFRERSALKRIRAHIETRLSGLAEVFHDMAKLFPSSGAVRPERLEVDEIVARCVGGVCGGCAYMQHCWYGEMETAEILLAALDEYRLKGAVKRPPEMANCERLDALMRVLDLSFDEYLSRIGAQMSAANSQGFLGRQMDSVANVVGGLAANLDFDIHFDEPMEHSILLRLNELGVRAKEVSAQIVGLNTEVHIVFVGKDDKPTRTRLQNAVSHAALHRMRLVSINRAGKNALEATFTDALDFEVEVGKAAKTKSGGAISGDSFGVQQLADGRCVIVLSDGMGSGETAARESRATVSLFTGLYAAGFDRESVLETINKLLILRGGETYATVDAVLIHRVSGKVEFIKFGAVPSVLVKEGRSIRIASESLPIGIVEAAKPEVFMRMLSEEDQIVLMSDGVWDVLPEDAAVFTDCLRMESAQAAADALLLAAELAGGDDDKSVIVVRLKNVGVKAKIA